MKSIAILFTGGTIGMIRTGRGAVPSFSGAELLASWPVETLDFGVHPIDFGQYPGPHMHGARVLELHAAIGRAFANHDAVVVTHGTDSIEETAFLLDLWHDRPEPVVVTGAMRTRDSPGWDGDLNLIDACRVAAADEARDRGVLVVMNRRIHAAGEVTKAVTDALDPLVSQPSGALGQLVDDRVDLFRPPLHRHRLPAPDAGSVSVLPWVELLTAHPDTDPRLVPALVQAGCCGLVVRAMGRGNVSPELAQGLTEAAGSGLPVVLVSRCAAGEPGADYGYVGGGADLLEAGIVFSPRLNDLKARLALTWLLQTDAGDDQIRGFFAGQQFSKRGTRNAERGI